jgi:predicted Zn-dependent peptidase
MGCPISSLRDGIFYEASVVNTYLAGGMTSKLYQELREKRGLCYSVFSMFMPLETSGMLLIYTATDAKHAIEAVDTIINELKRLMKKSMTQKEVAVFRKQLMGNFVLNSDDIEHRMNTLLMDSILERKYRTMNQMVKSIGSIRKKHIDAYLNKHLDLSKLSLLAIGNIVPKNWTQIQNRLEGIWKES